jgi:hypothetical protein
MVEELQLFQAIARKFLHEAVTPDELGTKITSCGRHQL